MKRSIASLLLFSTVAAAQSVAQQDLEQVWLDPSARGSLWVGNGTTQNYTVYGKVLGTNLNVTPDSYADTVSVTVTY